MAELSAATLVYKIKAVEQDIQNSKKRRDRLEALEAAGEAFDPRRLTAVQSELSALQSLLNCLMEKQGEPSHMVDSCHPCIAWGRHSKS